LEVTARTGDQDPLIGKITFDSRQVNHGDLFVAIRGLEADGHRYVDQALASGASAVVCEEFGSWDHGNIPVICVPDSRKALALMASAWFVHPSSELILVGVTGTNGKTTIATLLHQMHQKMGFRAGLISTIQVLIGEASRPATHTTPDPLRVNAVLRAMADTGWE